MLPWMWNCIFPCFLCIWNLWESSNIFGWIKLGLVSRDGVRLWSKFQFLGFYFGANWLASVSCVVCETTMFHKQKHRNWSIRFSEEATHWFLWGLAVAFQFIIACFCWATWPVCNPFFLIEIIFSGLYSCLLLCLCLSSAGTTQQSQQEFACRSMMALQWLLFSILPWVLTDLLSRSFKFQMCTSSFWCCSFPSRSVWQPFFTWLKFSAWTVPAAVLFICLLLQLSKV